jgi:hypothetical protein
MAGHDSVSVSEAADKMLTGEHADVVHEAVRLVIAELMEVEVAELAGADTGRGTVHFLRDMQGHAHRSQQQMVAAAIRHVRHTDTRRGP